VIDFSHLYKFGVWINSLENYPQHLVLSLKSLRPYSWDLPIQYPNPSIKNTLAQWMWPLMTPMLLTKSMHWSFLVDNLSRWCWSAMMVGRTSGQGRPWERISRYPSRCHRTWARGYNTGQHQLLTQIKILRETQQWVIELGAWETQVDHLPRGQLTSIGSDRPTFQAKQNALQRNLSAWGPQEPSSW